MVGEVGPRPTTAVWAWLTPSSTRSPTPAPTRSSFRRTSPPPRARGASRGGCRSARQDHSRYDYWKRTAFTFAQWVDLKAARRSARAAFLSSPFSLEAVELLEDVGVAAWKVASGEVTNLPMIARMAETGLPMFRLHGAEPHRRHRSGGRRRRRARRGDRRAAVHVDVSLSSRSRGAESYPVLPRTLQAPGRAFGPQRADPCRAGGGRARHRGARDARHAQPRHAGPGRVLVADAGRARRARGGRPVHRAGALDAGVERPDGVRAVAAALRSFRRAWRHARTSRQARKSSCRISHCGSRGRGFRPTAYPGFSAAP